MKKIKFSHVYCKMVGAELENPPKEALLLEVFKAKTEDLDKDFIEYDTVFDTDSKMGAFDYYKLPPGDIIILLFHSEIGLWTTIRRYTPSKYDYYKNSRGVDFDIIITG